MLSVGCNSFNLEVVMLLKTVVLIGLSYLLSVRRSVSAQKAPLVEEFQVYGPTDFHQAAMNKFMELRRKNPNITLNSDGEFLKSANEYAIARGRRRPDEALKLRVSSIFNFSVLLMT